MDIKNVDTIYSVSPVQEDFLFNLSQAAEPSLLCCQCCFTISGQLDVRNFDRAWQQIIKRHPVLRTSFVWKRVETPVQVVRKQTDNPLQFHDWRKLSSADQEQHLESLLASEAQRLSNPSELPLTHLAICQVSDMDYKCIWSFHPLLMDCNSSQAILEETFACYEKLCLEGVAQLKQTRAFQDYIAWLKRQNKLEAESFWRQFLEGIETERSGLSLVAGPPSGSKDIGSERQQIELCLDEQALQAFAINHQLDIDTLILGAWAGLLAQYGENEEVIFGVTTAPGRSDLQGSEPVIGNLISTLPLPIRVTPHATVEAWLNELQVNLSGLHKHNHASLKQVQRWANCNPLMFDTCIDLDARPQDNLLNNYRGHLSVNNIRFLSPLQAAFTLRVIRSSALKLSVIYDSQILDSQFVSGMLRHFNNLLQSIMANADQRLCDLTILTRPEYDQVINEWNKTSSEYPHLCIHELFEAQVERTPDTVAIISEGEQLSYEELNSRANQLAHYLMAAGVTQEVLVGIMMNRSVDMIISLLAVLKAGAAYVPLDPSYPSERLAFMLEDSLAPIVLTQQSLLDRLPTSWLQVISLDTDSQKIAKQDRANPRISILRSGLAYLIYTSGSTGNPKGVMINHEALVNRALCMKDRYELVPSHCMLQFVPLSFDAAAEEIFPTLTSGARLALHSSPTTMPITELLDICQDFGANALHMTAGFWHQIADELSSLNSAVPRWLELVIAGGERLSKQRVITWAESTRHPLKFFQAYGPTEATITSSIYELNLDPAALEQLSTIPIGRPMTNTEIYILNRYLQPAPVGVNGELFISGHGLARGYLNQPDLTADRFIPNPFSSSPGSRMYRSGDIARLLPDSNLLFLGRADHQVKIRGFRIELAEVEAAIRLHHLVSDCVVVSSSSSGTDSTSNRLVAYVVSDIPAHLLSSSLREWLKLKLPDFMLPSLFISIPGLPLTSNGKLDRKALPPADSSGSASQPGFQAARTPVEQQLVSIWSDVLGVASPGINDNFFDLGGDSILAVQVISRARAAGLHLSTSLLFQNQTIASLALVVDSRSLVLAQQSELSGPLPLTPIQLWFLLLHPDSPHHYNQSLLLESSLPLDPLLLRQALALLCRHHDALRLRFHFHLDAWHQSIIPFDDELLLDSFSTFDLADLPDHLLSSHISNLADRLQASLNISQGPIFRLALFKTGSQRPDRLLWIIHHLGVDAVSWRILLEDLESCYGQLSGGDEVSFSPKTTSYKEWAEALLRYSQSGQLSRQLPYWQGVQEADFDRLGVSDEGTDNCLSSEASLSLSLDQPRTARLLKQVPKVFATEINEVLLLALAEAMNRRAGISRLKVDLEGHGREEIDEQVDVTRTVGWFTSIYPVVIEVKQGDSLEQKVRRVKRTLREVPDKGIGYGVIRYLGAGAEGEGQAMREAANQWKASEAEVSFNYLGQVDQAAASFRLLRAGRESKGRERSEAGSRKYLIEVNSGVVGGELEVNWSYSRNKHSREEVEGMAREYISALSDFIDYALATKQAEEARPLSSITNLDQSSIARMIAADPRIEDIYPLSFAQQGIAFQSLRSGHPEMYFNQISCTLRGPLDVSAYRQAWEQTINRHAVLRTAILWKGLDTEMQAVHSQVGLDWHQEDWTDLSAQQQLLRLDAFLLHHRSRGFDLSSPPLLRFALLRLHSHSFHFVWSWHHLLVDGWSIPLLLNDVFSFYNALCSGSPLALPHVRPYRDYIAWLRSQELSLAEAFWRQTLRGFLRPTRLLIDEQPAQALATSSHHSAQEYRSSLSSHQTAGLLRVAQQIKVTLNTIAQGAWAIALSRFSREQDVVFGAVVAGRPVEMEGVEQMVGMFVNTLPVRVKVEGAQKVDEWLRQLQRQQVEARQYEYSPLVKVQGWSEMDRGVPLFDTIMAFENYPVDALKKDFSNGLEIEDVRTLTATNYPIAITVVPGSKLVLRVAYYENRFQSEAIRNLVEQFKKVLDLLASEGAATLNRLMELLDESDKQDSILKEMELRQARQDRFARMGRGRETAREITSSGSE